MAFAKLTNVDTVKSGGRVLVSGGTSIAERIMPDEDLLTLFEDPTHKPFYQVVMTKGTIIAVKQKADGRIVAVPCDSTADGDPNPLSQKNAYGVLVQDAFRPFDTGDSAPCSFVTSGYIEVPLIHTPAGFDNSALRSGDYVKSDEIGRFVAWTDGVDDVELRIGQVKFVEFFGEQGVVPATFDYGFLQYMQLPLADDAVTENSELDRSILEKVYQAHNPAAVVSGSPIFGVRGNLDVDNVYGACRINLFGM